MPQNDTKQAIERYNKSLAGQSSDDVHYWPFSDSGFIKFLYDLTRADLIQYHCKKVYTTEYNTQEFTVILQKKQVWDKNKELDNLRQLYAITSSQTLLSKIQTQLSESLEKLSVTQSQLSEAQSQLSVIKNSRSWRITKPLRALKQLIKKT